MNIADLNDAEALALVALMREVVQADGDYSPEEQASVKAIRDALGGERFDAAIERAKKELPDRAAVKAYAKTIERPDARWAIWEQLVDVARSDGVDAEEEKPLVWLANWWDLQAQRG